MQPKWRAGRRASPMRCPPACAADRCDDPSNTRYAIRQRVPVIVIDLKGGPTLAARLEVAAAAAGLAFGHFSTTPGKRRDPWNPRTLCDPATRRDKLIALSEWSEPYYRTVCERFAQRVFSMLDQAGEIPTVRRLIEHLDNPARLREPCAADAQSPRPADHTTAATPRPTAQHADRRSHAENRSSTPSNNYQPQRVEQTTQKANIERGQTRPTHHFGGFRLQRFPGAGR